MTFYRFKIVVVTAVEGTTTDETLADKQWQELAKLKTTTSIHGFFTGKNPLRDF